jgi:Zn-dependent protease with chaperone function
MLLRVLLYTAAALLCAACQTPPSAVEPAPPANEARVRRLLRVSGRVREQFPASRCTTCLTPSWTPNASITPGGQMMLTTGLMELCASDDQLAFVIAHELSHESLEHARRRMRLAWLYTLAAGAVVWAVQENGGSRAEGAAAGGGLLLSSALLHTLPALRSMEYEADLSARGALRRAGYRPEAAEEFWRRFARARPAKEWPLWLNDHPPDAARAARLEAAR